MPRRCAACEARSACAKQRCTSHTGGCRGRAGRGCVGLDSWLPGRHASACPPRGFARAPWHPRGGRLGCAAAGEGVQRMWAFRLREADVVWLLPWPVRVALVSEHRLLRARRVCSTLVLELHGNSRVACKYIQRNPSDVARRLTHIPCHCQAMGVAAAQLGSRGTAGGRGGIPLPCCCTPAVA